MTTLFGRRVLLRPLVPTDYLAWRDLRRRNVEWLTKWEPTRPPGAPDVIEDRDAFTVRCNARERERQLGTGHGFGVFVDGEVRGEVNLSSVLRGPFQRGTIGYWIDESSAGHGYTPEAVVVLLRHSFEALGLQRVEIDIVPRNTASRRVAEKLGLREEGLSRSFLEIDGTREDHVRYAIVADEWDERGPTLVAEWLT